MFVTKIGALSHNDEGCHYNESTPIISEKITVKNPHKSSKKAKKIYSAFSFESLEDIISVCRELYHIDYDDSCFSYIGDNGFYYLLIAGIDTTGYTPFDKFSFLNEFGTLENYEAIKYYLAEHGKKLCDKNTVATLSTC